VSLDDGVRGDLQAWRDIVKDERLIKSSFATPLSVHVKRPPDAMAISDACALAGGGFVEPLGLWWQVEWPGEVVRRFHVTEAGLAEAGEAVTIAHLELAALVLGVGVLCEHGEGQFAGKAVLALADNTNAVAWVSKAGAKDGRAAALMRMLGGEEAAGRWSLLAQHVPGVDNTTADYLSRHGAAEAAEYMRTVPRTQADVASPWSQVPPPESWRRRVFQLLVSTTPTTR
jgi:hypothetical protein